MANVTATDKFRDDPRFDSVGVLLGVDGDLVRMKMIRLWSWQTEHYTDDAPTYVVSRITLVGMFKNPGAPEALVEADLAEPRPDGFYIRGTEGEIEWLWKIRCASQAGGLKRAEQAKAAGREHGRFMKATSGPPAVHQPPDQPATSRPPANPPAEHQHPGSGIRDPEEEENSREPAGPAALFPPEPKAPDPTYAFASHAAAEISRVSGRRYGPSKAVIKLCRALVRAGHTTDEVTLVAEHKSREWLGGKLDARVCPATLLAADNFGNYLDEARAGPIRAPTGTGNHPPAPMKPLRLEDIR